MNQLAVQKGHKKWRSEIDKGFWNYPAFRSPEFFSGLLSSYQLVPEAPSASRLTGVVRVDYLVTIDPAVEGGRTDTIDRRVPPCVRRNLDYYQTDPNFVGSRGHPTVAVNGVATYVRSTDLTRELVATGREPHTHIDNYTHNTAARKIQEALLRPTYQRGHVPPRSIH